MPRRRSAAMLAVALVLSLLLAAPADAKAKKKPKPDRTPPTSTVHAEDMDVKIGMDADRDAPVQPPGPLYPYTVLEGTTRDNKGGRIDYVVIRFTREDPVGGKLGEIEVMTCEPPRRTCVWAARVPWLDDDLIDADPVIGVAHGLPAIWNVQVYAYDEAGNRETNGPELQIVVI